MQYWRLALTLALLATAGSSLVRAEGAMPSQKATPKGCKYVSPKQQGTGPKTLVCTPTKLKSPTGIAVGKSGNVWVMDSGHGRLLKISPQGRLLGKWGAPGSGPGQFMAANFIDLDARGNLYVADSVNDRVQKLSSKGVPLARWGSAGQAPGSFIHPTGVALDRAGALYVSDTYNNRIQKLSAAGVTQAGWGEGLSLHHPSGLAIDSQGMLFVADSRNQRIVAVSPDGHALRSWGTETGLAKPDGLAEDAQDHVYVTDRSTNRVLEFTASGSVLKSWGGSGTGPGRFHFADRGYLNGVAVDAHGDIWVADTGNDRVQELSPAGRVLAIWL